MGDEEKIRVLVMIDRLGLHGGGERIATALAMRLDPGRFERTLCVTRRMDGLESEDAGRAALAALEDAGVELLALERGSRLDLLAWSRLRRYLRERAVSVVHSHKFGSNIWGAAIGRLSGTEVVIAHEHSWSYRGRPLRRLLDRELIARNADAIVAVSAEDRRRMIEVERIPERKIRLIANGMPPPLIPPAGGDLRAELGLGAGPVIGTVTEVRPEKRLDLLLEAVARLQPRFSGVQLVVAGRGDPAPLRAQAARLGIESRVKTIGYRADVAAVLEALDLAVNCSEREGTPLSVLEYMEAGLPVVASRVGGIPDLIEDGEHGLLVEPGDADGLTAALAELLGDPGRAARLGAAAKARRRSEFDFDRMVRRVEELYLELLEAKRARRGAA